MKILLDPLIYWFPNDSEKELNLLYLDKVTLIMGKYFELKYISSRFFIQILQRLNKEPFSTSKEQNGLRQKIIKRLLQNLDYPNNISDPNCEHYTMPEDFEVTNNNELNEYFTKIFNYLLMQNISCILLLSKKNHKVDLKSINQMFVTRNISGEVNSKITELIQDGHYLKHGLPEPILSNPLPFSELCEHYLDLQNEMKKNDDAMSVFWRITQEVALRNRYSFDIIVTNKNNSNKHKRKIYTYNKSHYISADFESGCFELCDHKGEHKGEISYTGNELSPPDKTGRHDIEI